MKFLKFINDRWPVAGSLEIPARLWLTSPTIQFEVAPLFKNYSFGYKYPIDYDLQSTSPTIRTGLDLSISGDYFGHKRKHSPPDIGAIEYKFYRGYK